MKQKHALLALLLTASLLLCSCTAGSIPMADNTPEITLPPAEVSYVAPIGDASLEYTADVDLYLPRHDGTQLTTVTAQASFSSARPNAESLVRALLSFVGDGVASPVGGSVRLSLYGVNPVEVSRDTVTVNLAASALQLGRDALYIAFQSITNTLTQLPEINYVNFLVVDKPVGADIANTLPLGAMSRSTGQDVDTAYQQLLSRRVGAQESAADKPLTSNVTLYFPLANAPGLVSEVRSISFGNQVLSSMIATLLGELAIGPTQQEIHSPALPLLGDLLVSTPTVIASESLGGQVITLDFAYNLDEMLDAYGLTRQKIMASLCYTLCTFFPNAAGVRLSIDGEQIGALTTSDGAVIGFENNVITRADFADMLYDYCTLFFASEDGKRLVATRRPAPYYQRTSPRALLRELSLGPMACDSISGLAPVMPADALADPDILGLALDGHTLLLNLSPSFDALGESTDIGSERLLAYAIVNTLCVDERVKSICFFRSGSQFDGFTGEIYWRGLFHPMAS